MLGCLSKGGGWCTESLTCYLCLEHHRRSVLRFNVDLLMFQLQKVDLLRIEVFACAKKRVVRVGTE